ncbi:hypothetical protein SD70_03175 [Gordoniibacillus kamchatkensis]|uniref:DUF3231 family protein n=2 Tax=Gordoniibacillus kamchatkensis TaxID=1590651 RepID=A0ABR5AMF7_9BACL|nr:hypothetical protein SD70_03175 [Paenibacillus sp. VKM B-2647]
MDIEKMIDNTETNVKLTSAEIGKLWATYMGNSMSKCVLNYYLNHVEDQDIQQVLQQALHLSEQFVDTIKNIFQRDNVAVPVAFTEEDVNVGAPRLYEDEFYLHYLKYAAKAGMSIYIIAIPIMTRSDVRTFFTHCLNSTVKLINEVNDILAAKGYLIKPPYIPMPDETDFVTKQNYLNGFFGDVRPLHALEIAHLYDNIQNNATSKAVLIGFGQVAKLRQVKDYFRKGKEICSRHIDICSELLTKEDLPALPLVDHLVTESTFSPFSDKLMMFHKLDMFAMRIRNYGNSMAVSARHDLAAKYAKFIVDVGNYVEDGANTMIDLGWMEQPPKAADRDAIVKK